MPPLERNPACVRAAATRIRSLQWYYRCTLMPVVVVTIGFGTLGTAFDLPTWLRIGQFSLFGVAGAYSLFLVALLRWSACPMCGGWFFNLWATKGAANRGYSDRGRCNACGVSVEDMLSAGDSKPGEHA